MRVYAKVNKPSRKRAWQVKVIAQKEAPNGPTVRVDICTEAFPTRLDAIEFGVGAVNVLRSINPTNDTPFEELYGLLPYGNHTNK